MNKNSQVQIMSRRLLIGALTLSIASPGIAAPKAGDEHSVKVTKANELIYEWQDNEAQQINNYLLTRGQPHGPNEDFDIHIDTKKIKIKPQTQSEKDRDAATNDLVLKYYGHQGMDRLHGVFIESGAVFADNHQWNTQRAAGFAIKELREAFLDKAVENKIFNVRLGINIHELDFNRPETLDGILDFHRSAWSRGIAITDAVLFFSGLKSLETKYADGQVDPTQSATNNPKFATYAEKVADFVLTAVFKEQALFNAANAKLPIKDQKPVARTAINPVNEPETFAGFNHFWNGAFATWGDPNTMRLYVPTIINIARANVRIRLAADRAANGERVLYFHNEAMTPKEYPSHKGDLQFAVSKLMLGDDQLMKADFSALRSESLQSIRQRFDLNKSMGTINVVEAAILHFVEVPLNNTEEKKENARQAILDQLQLLKNDHLEYAARTHKTAKTDTIVMFDYYQQSEFILPKPVPQMVEDLSANHGELLKKILMVEDDNSFLNILKERTLQAEAVTGQKIWQAGLDRKSIDFKKLLTAEDSIVLDKLIGLRNEINLKNEALFVERRNRAGFNAADLTKTDERRLDIFLGSILQNNAQLLKSALQVKTDAQLMTQLEITINQGRQAHEKIVFNKNSTLREIMNLSERYLLHQVFGIERIRRNGFLPPHYARQTRAEMRKGFYETMLTYIPELGIHIGGIGESGTPYFPWASTLHKQMMLALVAAAKASDFYIVRNDIGPAVGTIGWMNGPMIGNLKTNGRRGEDGIFKLVRTAPYKFEYQLSAWPGSKPWYSEYREDFARGMTAAQVRIDAKNKNKMTLVFKQNEVQTEKKSNSKTSVLSCSNLF